MDEDFEQNHSSKTEKNVYKYGQDCIKLMKCMAEIDRCHEKLNCFDLMGSVLSALNGTNEQ